MPESSLPVVHHLSRDDLAWFRELLTVFGKAFEDMDTYTRFQPDDAYLEALLQGDQLICLAAVHEDSVVGGLAAYELKKFEQNRSEIYIYDLAVVEEWRRKGIATSLIMQLKTIAKERGAGVIYVQADSGDDPAIELYTKLGVKEEVLHFDIAV